MTSLQLICFLAGLPVGAAGLWLLLVIRERLRQRRLSRMPLSANILTR